MSRVFYGVSLGNDYYQDAFDLVTILANPFKENRSRAHVTLRGPYEAKLPAKDIPNIKTKYAQIAGVDKFSTPKGAAVVLVLNIENVRDVWDKPDFPDGVPHITVYEGDDKGFIRELMQMLDAVDLAALELPLSDMQIINGKFSSKELVEDSDSIKGIYKLVMGEDWPSLHAIRGYDPEKRLSMIEGVFERLITDSLVDDDRPGRSMEASSPAHSPAAIFAASKR